MWSMAVTTCAEEQLVQKADVELLAEDVTRLVQLWWCAIHRSDGFIAYTLLTPSSQP